MFSKVPISLSDLDKTTINKSILRASIIAELDATAEYEQFANMTDDERIKKVLFDVAREEKTHAGEFLTVLNEIDPEQAKQIVSAQKEVKDLTGISSNI